MRVSELVAFGDIDGGYDGRKTPTGHCLDLRDEAPIIEKGDSLYRR